MSKENCELLSNTKDLANKRGLDPSRIECMFLKTCKGTKCFMMDLVSPKIEKTQKLLQRVKP